MAVGGFAFAPDGGARAALGGLRAGLADRARGRARAQRARGGDAARCALTLAALASPDDVPEELLARLRAARSAELRARALPLLDPAPAGRFQVASAMPPEHYEAAVARAVELIGAGRAREDRARARGAGPRAARRMTRRPCSACCARSSPPASCFCVGRGEATLDRREPRAARAPRGPAREHARARRLDAPQRRPGRRRPPRRAAAARRELPRGARDRRAADRAHAAPARDLGHRRARARAGADRQHPAPGDADPRAAGGADRGARAGRADAPDAGGRRRAAAPRRAADPGARGARPRLVRGPGRLDRRDRRRRVLRGPALRAAARRPSPAATPATASCATPTRRASSPRPRSSCRRCCRCWRAERARRPRSHTRRVQLDVARALGRAPRRSLEPLVRERALERRAERRRRRRRARARGRTARRRCAKSSPVGVAMWRV